MYLSHIYFYYFPGNLHILDARKKIPKIAIDAFFFLGIILKFTAVIKK